MSARITVVIADAQPIIREGLRISLERGGLIEVVAEAEDGYAATLAVSSRKPNVVILDSGIRKLECLDAILRIRAQSPLTRILITTFAQNLFEVQALLEAGVGGILAKTALPLEYQNAVQALMGGGSYFSGALAADLFAHRRSTRTGANIYGLTTREIEILRFICQGFSNKDIARRCTLSVRTIETHRFNIRKKTSASRLRDLVHVGRQLSLVESELELVTPELHQPANPLASLG